MIIYLEVVWFISASFSILNHQRTLAFIATFSLTSVWIVYSLRSNVVLEILPRLMHNVTVYSIFTIQRFASVVRSYCNQKSTYSSPTSWRQSTSIEGSIIRPDTILYVASSSCLFDAPINQGTRVKYRIAKKTRSSHQPIITQMDSNVGNKSIIDGCCASRGKSRL